MAIWYYDVIDTQQFFVDNSCSVCFVRVCARVRVHVRACVIPSPK